MLVTGDSGGEYIVSMFTVHPDLLPTHKLLSPSLSTFIDPGDSSWKRENLRYTLKFGDRCQGKRYKRRSRSS